ncbi:bifunctional metallophosphatase/5'-nucleotidase [Halobacteriales archaeon SW_6_65_46]|nr:MAG: bifunctional metallophosphatase/5'-nucleotidase [Halobacteriales archaeon SW_6_65_46]
MAETPDADESEFTLNRRGLLTAAGGIAVASATGGVASATQPANTVTLIHDTHFHGRFEDAGDAELNLPRYFAVADRLREEYDNAAFIGNGDDLAPSLLGLEYEGRHMVEALNYMQPAAIGAGNHDFDFGVETATNRFGNSEFPWVVANLLTPDGEPVPETQRWTTFEAGSATVGVFGLVTESFYTITDYPDDWQVLDTVEAAREAVAALDGDADFIVCASHLSSGAQEQVAKEVDGLDAVVGSHSGIVFDEPATIGGTTVAEFGDEFGHLGRLTFDLDTGELGEWERFDFYNAGALDDGESPPGGDSENHVPRDVQEITGDEELASITQEYTTELEERLGQPVVESEVELNATSENYAVETGIGNLITDLMRDVGNFEDGIDVAVQNAGGIRSNTVYGPGPITGVNVMDILPFPNEIEVYELSGAKLRQYVRDSVRPMPGDFGSQPAIQVSGISYEWRGHDGESSVENVFVGGEPLDEEETYLVSTNDYVAGRSVIGEGERVLSSGQFQGPFVMDQLEERDTISPTRGHRMIRVDETVEPATVEGDDDTVTLTASLPTDAAEGVAPDSYRVIPRVGESLTPESVSAADGTVTATFDATELTELAEIDDPTLRLVGGFDPDEEHYGYTNDEGELIELPPSSGYDYHQLKASVDASAVLEATATATATDDETEATTDSDAETETTGDQPGFGTAAAVGGAAGGAYLYDRLTDDDSAE